MYKPSNDSVLDTRRAERSSNSDKTLEWQMSKPQSSTPAMRGSSGGGGRRSDKKPEHKFSSGVAKSNDYAMQQFMRESQGPRGTAPWTPVWTFPKGGGGQKK